MKHEKEISIVLEPTALNRRQYRIVKLTNTVTFELNNAVFGIGDILKESDAQELTKWHNWKVVVNPRV